MRTPIQNIKGDAAILIAGALAGLLATCAYIGVSDASITLPPAVTPTPQVKPTGDHVCAAAIGKWTTAINPVVANITPMVRNPGWYVLQANNRRCECKVSDGQVVALFCAF